MNNTISLKWNGRRRILVGVFLSACFLAMGGPGVGAATGEDSNPAWFDYDPPRDVFRDDAALDLRFMNERVAGEHGFIGVRGDAFVHSGNGESVRFWGVNGPPEGVVGDSLRQGARMLAKRGVNLVRVHGALFDSKGEVDSKKVLHAIEVVEAMKAEGIYTHFSIYFPLWLNPSPSTQWLQGYDGNQHPFAALFFNRDFQEQYRGWWTALLTTPSPASGRRLVDEPAVMALEVQNEDSFFFWTFATKNLPEEQWRLLEGRFYDWLVLRHGSIEKAFVHWKGLKVEQDAPGDGRIGFRPLWNVFNEKTVRDQDTVRFLFELQAKFYEETVRFLKSLGYKGLITASNWTTASAAVLGPIEKLSYTKGDFLDRHGYFGANHKGENAAWSIRAGHTTSDRSALRFDAEAPDQPRQFVHPAMDPHYDGKPSMISETTWNRPNRHRSEAPLFYAAYGALQHTDAVIHFALDGFDWSVKPRFFMQPWTLMSPAMMGQFPAAALIFRRGLITPGAVLAQVQLNREELLELKGTPLPEGASLDELRLQDVPKTAAELNAGMRLDPRMHFAGRVDVRFTDGPASVKLEDLRPWLDDGTKTIRSSTGELRLDYGDGLLVIDSDRAQGVSGNLLAAGRTETKDLVWESTLDVGHLVVVALDNKPLGVSGKMLLQVMSEERTSGFRTEPVSGLVKRIVDIGRDPWQVKEISGTIVFKRGDAADLRVTALDPNGSRIKGVGSAAKIVLLPNVWHYMIE